MHTLDISYNIKFVYTFSLNSIHVYRELIAYINLTHMYVYTHIYIDIILTSILVLISILY